jgi:hypothetical protein
MPASSANTDASTSKDSTASGYVVPVGDCPVLSVSDRHRPSQLVRIVLADDQLSSIEILRQSRTDERRSRQLESGIERISFLDPTRLDDPTNIEQYEENSPTRSGRTAGHIALSFYHCLSRRETR